jgi:CRP-like cAMP-binding protein
MDREHQAINTYIYAWCKANPSTVKSDVNISPQSLFRSIVSKAPMTEAEFDTIAHNFNYETIDKKQRLVTEGHYTNKAFFIQKGLLFSYKTLDSGDIQVVRFAKENFWIGDLNSFMTGAKALFTIEALEPSELWSMTREGWQRAMKSSPAFETYFRILVQTAYANLLVELSDIYSEDSKA